MRVLVILSILLLSISAKAVETYRRFSPAGINAFLKNKTPEQVKGLIGRPDRAGSPEIWEYRILYPLEGLGVLRPNDLERPPYGFVVYDSAAEQYFQWIYVSFRDGKVYQVSPLVGIRCVSFANPPCPK